MFLNARGLAFAAAGLFALTLAACAGNEDIAATGSAFSQSLYRDYSDLAVQTAALPAPITQEPRGTLFSTLTFGLFEDAPSNPDDLLVQAFNAKAELAHQGSEPAPEPANDAVVQGLRARLVRAIAAGKDQFPDQAARAQVDFDCMVLNGTAGLVALAQSCRTELDRSLLALENAARPAPPPRVTLPPVAAPAPPPPPQASENTVYFEFDSWTLRAEDLAVITNVINTARAGGQSRITVVGHADTSGSADYNQKLSVNRANVVTEALVNMGARRAAITVSGVGENDLAVQTPDGVKEARNRRAVIGLLP